MVSLGMAKAGYQYIFIDDWWQGGSDNQNTFIPDPTKFPSGIEALADYVHRKGLKLGIYQMLHQAQLQIPAVFVFPEFSRKSEKNGCCQYRKIISPLLMNIPVLIAVHLYAKVENIAEVFPIGLFTVTVCSAVYHFC